MSFKKILVSSVAAATIASSLSANVIQSAEQTGNYLVFPKVYGMTEGGNWSTEFSVVNTNTTAAVIAKVIVRAQEDSAELLDFPLYLSPGDVFVGKISQDTSGEILFTTSDDSWLSLDGTPASTTAVSQQLHKTKQSTDGSKNELRDGTRTYIEVFQVAKKLAKDIASDAGKSWTEKTPLAKAWMQAQFRDSNATNANSWDEPFDGVNATDLYGQEIISATDVDSERSMTLMATAFRNEFSAKLSTLDDSLAQDQFSIRANLSTVSNTIGDIRTPINSAWGAMNDREFAHDIFDDMNKTHAYVSYETKAAAENQLHLTIPMKHLYIAKSTDSEKSDYFLEDQNVTGLDESYDWCYFYGSTVRDRNEQTYIEVTEGNDFSGGEDPSDVAHFEVCKEQKSIDVLAKANPKNFTEGYVDITFYGNDKVADATDKALSVPVIPVAMTGIKVNNASITNIYYPAYK